MSVKTFQNEVIKNEGYILSDGTLNLEDLLSKSYDTIVGYEIHEDCITNDILSVFTMRNEVTEIGSLFTEKFYGDAYIEDEKLEYASSLWNEAVVEFFMDISPSGYYFGSTDGDGALIGWFKDYENDEHEGGDE